VKKEVDINKWSRKSHFHFFKDFDNPFYNICSNIEISELLQFCKENKSSFFLASLYLSIKAANEINEFRYRIEGQKVYAYDIIHPFSTVLNDDNTFSFCEFTYSESFREFEDLGKLAISKTNKYKLLIPKENRRDVIHYTTIPWISLTSISHAKNFYPEDSIPKFVLGKYFEYENKVMIPFSIEVHHSLVDGYHVGKYYEIFREIITNCYSILSR